MFTFWYSFGCCGLDMQLGLSETKVAVVLAIVSSLVFSNSIFCDFVFDDFSAVKNNKDLEGSAPWSDLLWNDYWGTPISEERSHKSYRPLTVTTFKLNNIIFGREAWSYHLVNIILHAGVTVLYFKLCSAVCEICSKHATQKKTKQSVNIVQNGSIQSKLEVTCEVKWQQVAYIAAFLFAVHPIHTEAVSGIVGRAELLCAMFMILTFLFYIKSRTRYIILSSVFCICAVASKEQGITIVAILIVFDFFVLHRLTPLELLCFRKTFNIHTALRSAVLCLVACVILYWRFSIMGGDLPSFTVFDNPAAVNVTPTRQLTYNYVLAVNLFLLINPSGLLCDWTMRTIPLVTNISDPRNLITVLFWVVIFFLSFIAASKKDPSSKAILSGLSFLVFPFIPASNLFFPVGFVIAERVLYAPSMGYCLLVAIGIEKLINFTKFKKVMICAFVLIILSFSCKTVIRNSQWQSDYTLFQSGLQVTKNNAKIWNNVGHSLEIDDPKLAMRYFLEAVKVQPNDIGSHMNVGRINKRLGLLKEAEESYIKAKDLLPKPIPGKTFTAKIAPVYLQLYVQLGNLIKVNKSRLKEVDSLYKEVLSMRDDFTDAYINRGEILMLMGKFNEAIKMYSTALKYSDKKDDMYFNMAVLHSQMGNVSGAVEYYTYAIQENPDHIKALYNSAVIFEETGIEDLIKRAKIRVERILSKEPDNYLALSLLGSIYLDYGDEKTAKNYWKRVLEIHPDDKSALYNTAYMYSKKDDKIEECIEHLKKLLSFYPEHVKALTLYGDILLSKKKDTKGASEAFNRLIKADPNNIQARHNLCVVILEEGRLTDAGKCMEDVFIMAPEAKFVANSLAIIKKHIAKREKDDQSSILNFSENDRKVVEKQRSKNLEHASEGNEVPEEDFVFVEPIRKKVKTSETAKAIMMDAKNTVRLATEKDNKSRSPELLETALKKVHSAVEELKNLNGKLDKDLESKCPEKKQSQPIEVELKPKKDVEELRKKALDYLDELEAGLP